MQEKHLTLARADCAQDLLLLRALLSNCLLSNNGLLSVAAAAAAGP